MRGLAAPQHVDALEPVHVEVEHQHVGGMPLDRGERRDAIGRFGDDFELRLRFEDAPDAGAHQRVVVGEDDADPRPRRRPGIDDRSRCGSDRNARGQSHADAAPPPRSSACRRRP